MSRMKGLLSDFAELVPPGGRSDPYLFWAKITAFEGYRGRSRSMGQDGKFEVVVAFETAEGTSNCVSWKDAAAWNVRPLRGTHFGTARLLLKDLPKLVRLVKRLELSMPVLAEPDTSPDGVAHAPSRAVRASELLKGKVIAVIDDGFAHMHREFVDAKGQKNRIQYLWDQECSVEIIRNGVLEGVLPHAGNMWEESVYLQQKLRGALKAFSHGTLIASLAGGRSRPGWRMERFGKIKAGVAGAKTTESSASSDEASDCKLILVQFPRRTADDNSGSSLSAQTLSALSYIGSRCAQDANLVVNLSYGPAAGPHDGSSLLEAALDAFVEARGELKTAVVVPAGNQYQTRGHACFSLDPDGAQQLKWHVLPDDATESFVEIWIPHNGQISVQLIPPNSYAANTPWVAIGELGMQFWADAPDPQCAVIAAPLNAKGDGRMVLLALGPTATQVPRRPTRHGGWTINIKNDNAKEAVTVHAWVQRDDPTLSAIGRGGRQSYFEDGLYERWDSTGRPQLKDTGKSVVRRDGSFSPIATGKKTCKAGAYRLSDDEVLPYSGGGEGLLVTAGPDVVSVAEESVTVRGILGAGTRGASMVRGNGTSVAAPQFARQLLTALDGSRSRSQLIKETIRPWPATRGGPSRRGEGKLNT